MLTLKITATLAALAALTAAALPAAAQTSPFTVFGTGVNTNGAVLANGTLGDPHYTVSTNAPGGSSQLQVLTSAYGFPIVKGGWIGDSSTSAWIAPTNDPFLNGGQDLGGYYDYQTTFDLTGYDPATASLSGNWAADDSATFLINGVATGQNTPNGYSSYSTFDISSGFQPGINTLDFVVLEDGSGATGLRVDGITGSAAAVPEASSTVSLGLLLALGVGGVLVARRKAAKA